MSQENVEIVRQLVQAFNRRDPAAIVESLDPEIEFTPAGPAAVERAVYAGRDDVASGLASIWETWEVFQLEEAAVRDLADSILWLGRVQIRGSASHIELDQEFAVRIVVHAGRLVRVQSFLAWQEALEAAGIRE